MTTLLELEFAQYYFCGSPRYAKLKLSGNLSARVIKAILSRQFKSAHEQKEKLIKKHQEVVKAKRHFLLNNFP